MFKYKRGINNIEQAKQVEYVLSNNNNSCLSMSATLDTRKPYNGMYIKDGKIIVENLMEEIELKNKLYRVGQVMTSVQTISCDEYITNIDLEKNTFNYDFGDIKFSKSFCFSKDSDLLCIRYDIFNNTTNNAKFRILPLITYRELFKMKDSQSLRFNQRKVNNGVLVNLSIVNEENVVIKSDKSKYTKESRIITNVKHEYITKQLEKEITTEDLFVPGNFEIDVKKESNQIFNLYICQKDFNIENVDVNEIFTEYENSKNSIKSGIRDEYVELKDLAMQISNFNMNDKLIDTLPYEKHYELNFDYEFKNGVTKEDIITLTNIVKSIEGQYLTFDKIKDANNVLIKIRRYIRQIEDIKNESINKDFVLLKLWYIESANRLIQKESKFASLYLEFIHEILYDLFIKEEKDRYLTDIQTCALSYNAIKIYENLLEDNDDVIYEIGEYINSVILTKFWDEEKRTMKENITDVVAKPNIHMIYTLSLSYPCIVGDIQIKLLDTIFKELYTPYGLRSTPRSSNEPCYIYPKYMAHFVKANLRQNGVTRASQKIAFNLVKELFQDINKYINGAIKYIYSEKGVLVDSRGYDLYTNAEIIRLYDMLS